MDNKKSSYDPSIDATRLVAILAVILIHTSTRVLEVTNFDLIHTSWTLFLNQASRFAVPLFFLISGFVLELSSATPQTIWRYLQKRTSRLFIPFVFWSVIYYFLIYRQHKSSFLSVLATGDASYQLYFIPALILLYLLFPLIHKFYLLFSKKWVLLVLGLIEIGLLYLDYSHKGLLLVFPLRVAVLNFYVFILGIVASKHQKQILTSVEQWKIILIPSAVVAACFVYLEGKYNYLTSGNYLYFYSQWRPSVLLYTLLVGSLLFYFFNKVLLKESLVKNLSQLSFFVFLVHVIVLEILWTYVGVQLFPGAANYWFDLSYFACVTIVSFLLAYMVHKIPHLAKLTG